MSCRTSGLTNVAFISTIPTPYRRPMLDQIISSVDEIDLTVYYCSSGSIKRPWELDFSNFRKTTFLNGWSVHWCRRPIHVNLSIINELQKERFDVVVINGYSHPTTLLAALWCMFTNTQYILMCESHLNKPTPHIKKWLKLAFLKPFISSASAHLAVGTNAREYLISYGASPEGIFIFPNTPDVERFDRECLSYREHRQRLKSDLGIEPDAPVVCFVGRLAHSKGVDVLLKALRYVQRSYPDIECLIVGDGPVRNDLDKIRKEAQIRNVHFVGFRQPDELPQFYAISDVFVLPSRVEPWGVVVNEAMACHLPVVATDRVGAVSDLVKSGENGFVVPVNSPLDLASALRKIVSDPNLARAMGERSRQIVDCWKYERGIQGFLNAIRFAIQDLDSGNG